MSDQEVHLETDRARAGSTPHIARYVLAISFVLVVIGMILVVGLK